MTTNEVPVNADMAGAACLVCTTGTYQETSLYDDWEGTLHCSSCGHEVRRYPKGTTIVDDENLTLEELPPVTEEDFRKGIEEVVGIMGEVFQLHGAALEAAKELYPEGHRVRKEVIRAQLLLKQSAERLAAAYRSTW